MFCFIFATSYFLMLWCFLSFVVVVFFQLMFVFCCLLLFMDVMLICVLYCFVFCFLLLCCDCDTLWDPLKNEMVHIKGLILINKFKFLSSHKQD